MKKVLDGNAIVYCEGAFNTPNGKTTHGLVRFTERFHILSVVITSYSIHYTKLYDIENGLRDGRAPEHPISLVRKAYGI